MNFVVPANCSDSSGFSSWMASILANIVQGLDPWLISLICSVFAALFTEICSNTATSSMITPILAELARQMCIHPLYLMLPATLACIMSFMLPAATPPNAIAFGSGRLKATDMIKSGILANLIGIVIINLLNNTWLNFYYDFDSDDYKSWANESAACT